MYKGPVVRSCPALAKISSSRLASYRPMWAPGLRPRMTREWPARLFSSATSSRSISSILRTMLLDLRDNAAVLSRHRLSFHDSSDNEFGPGGCRQPPCGAAHPRTKAAGVPADTTACPQAPPMHAGGGRRTARVPDMIANAAHPISAPPEFSGSSSRESRATRGACGIQGRRQRALGAVCDWTRGASPRDSTEVRALRREMAGSLPLPQHAPPPPRTNVRPVEAGRTRRTRRARAPRSRPSTDRACCSIRTRRSDGRPPARNRLRAPRPA